MIKWPATYCIDTEAKALAHPSQAISPGGWESLQVSGFNWPLGHVSYYSPPCYSRDQPVTKKHADT